MTDLFVFFARLNLDTDSRQLDPTEFLEKGRERPFVMLQPLLIEGHGIQDPLGWLVDFDIYLSYDYTGHFKAQFIVTPQDPQRNRDTARKRQERRRTRLIADAWSSACLRQCGAVCPWGEAHVDLVDHEDGDPICTLPGAARGRVCAYERRLHDEATKQLREVYSESTAAMLATSTIQLLRAEAEGNDTLALRIKLGTEAAKVEVRLREILLRDERERRRIDLQERRLQLDAPRKTNAQIVADAISSSKQEAAS